MSLTELERSFMANDPMKDTESCAGATQRPRHVGFMANDPMKDTESRRDEGEHDVQVRRFMANDPMKDTESSSSSRSSLARLRMFHGERSDEGY